MYVLGPNSKETIASAGNPLDKGQRVNGKQSNKKALAHSNEKTKRARNNNKKSEKKSYGPVETVYKDKDNTPDLILELEFFKRSGERGVRGVFHESMT